MAIQGWGTSAWGSLVWGGSATASSGGTTASGNVAASFSGAVSTLLVNVPETGTLLATFGATTSGILPPDSYHLSASFLAADSSYVSANSGTLGANFISVMTAIGTIIPPKPLVKPALPNSYSTWYIYNSVPEFIRQQDAAVPPTTQNPYGYPLFYYLYSICQLLDDLNVLIWDNMGAGVTVQPTELYEESVTQAYLATGINSSTEAITIFGTDATWNQINQTAPFVVQLEGEKILVAVAPGSSTMTTTEYSAVRGPIGAEPLGGELMEWITSTITVPGTYNWLAPSVTLTISERGYDNTIAVAHNVSSGADGVIDLKNYASAPGWSQAIDIDRCPQYALPWLGQFIGTELAQNNGLTYQQTISKIQNRSGFQRATPASIVAELVNVINSQLTMTQTPIVPGQIIILENTALMAPRGGNLFTAISSTSATTVVLTNTDSSWGTLGSNSGFVIEIGSEQIYIPQGTYNWLGSPVTITGVTRGYNGTTKSTYSIGAGVTVVGGTSVYGFNEYGLTLLLPAAYFNIYTYATLITAVAGNYSAANAFVGYYYDLAGSAYPSSVSPYINFVYRYRPAGIELYVGAY